MGGKSRSRTVYVVILVVSVAVVVAAVALVRSRGQSRERAAETTLPAAEAEKGAAPTEEEMLDVKRALDDSFRGEPVDIRAVARHLETNRDKVQ